MAHRIFAPGNNPGMIRSCVSITGHSKPSAFVLSSHRLSPGPRNHDYRRQWLKSVSLSSTRGLASFYLRCQARVPLYEIARMIRNGQSVEHVTICYVQLIIYFNMLIS
jgi:hypothetical protein